MLTVSDLLLKLKSGTLTLHPKFSPLNSITQSTILLLCLVYASLAFGQQDLQVFDTPADQILIWQGFKHEWTYNHRINRIGNFVHNENGNITSVHASATGLGADSTFYSSRYAILENTGLAHLSGKARFVIDYKEKDFMTQTLKARISLPRGFKGTDIQLALLNGFDLLTLDQADKLNHLHIELGSVQYNEAEDYLNLNIRVGFMVDCQSVECHMFRQLAIYQLDVYFTILGGTTNQLLSQNLTLDQEFEWDRRKNGEEVAQEHVLTNLNGGVYRQAVLGYQSFTIDLDQAHWFTNLSNCLIDPNYSSEEGWYSVSWEAAFQEWKPGMRRNSANRKQSMFAMKRRGDCLIQSEMVLIQFNGYPVEYQENEGVLFWPGKNRSPRLDEASISVTHR